VKTPDLKPCPFCGRKALKTSWYRPDTNVLYQVSCSDKSSDCVVHPETSWYTDEKKAIDAWNRRANDES
jgi:Lar family restriction alleviation protein